MIKAKIRFQKPAIILGLDSSEVVSLISGVGGKLSLLISIITLFVVMQMTARINWTEKFRLNADYNKELETKLL